MGRVGFMIASRSAWKSRRPEFLYRLRWERVYITCALWIQDVRGDRGPARAEDRAPTAPLKALVLVVPNRSYCPDYERRTMGLSRFLPQNYT